jgi:hypothetical protein
MVVVGGFRERASRCGLSSSLVVVVVVVVIGLVAFGEDVGSGGGVVCAVGSGDGEGAVWGEVECPAAFVDEVVVPSA